MTGAWASVAYIQDQLTLGWFVRGLHSFGSSALIVVAGLHLLQVLLFGAYRRPRELNWMVGLALFGVVALFALSGYLLPWDQKGYWAKLVEATITGSAPVVGGAAQQLIAGRRRVRQPDPDPRLRAARDGAARAADRRCWCCTSTCSGATATRRSGRCRRRTRPRARPPAWPDQAVRNAVVGALAWGVVAVAVIAPPRRARWNRPPIRRRATSPAPSGTRCRSSSCACSSRGRWRSWRR